MKVEILEKDDKHMPCDALILPVFEGEKNAYREIDRLLGGPIKKAISSGEFKAKHLDSCIIHTSDRIKPDRLLLIGLGEKKKFNYEKMRQCGGKAASTALKHNLKELALSTLTLNADNRSPVVFAEGVILGAYRFTTYRK